MFESLPKPHKHRRGAAALPGVDWRRAGRVPVVTGHPLQPFYPSAPFTTVGGIRAECSWCVWGLGARHWAPRSLLGTLGDGLLADRWRENGTIAVCLLTLLFLSFFFLSPFPDTGVKDNIYRKPPIYKQHGTCGRIPLLLFAPHACQRLRF